MLAVWGKKALAEINFGDFTNAPGKKNFTTVQMRL